MRKVFKYLLYLLLLAAVVVGGVSAYFAMVDWDKNKQVIADLFSEVTGKIIEFDGPVSFRLFPFPYLSAADVKVYSNFEGEKKLLAKANNLIANLSLYPLVKGDFEVTRMSIVEPDITFEMTEGDKFNWYTALTDDQKYMLETAEVTLESVTIEKARVKFTDPSRDIDFMLENLNAEVTAETLMGPYRIDGSYMRDGEREGFAVSIGQLSSSFATNVGFVINYPQYETYVRFDGSILPNNYAINGSVIVESAQISSFLGNMLKFFDADGYYNMPLALSMELNTNQSQTNLNNVVIKYGNSVGAGSILIPRGYSSTANSTDMNRKMQIQFSMTDLDLEPVAYGIKKFVEKYSSEEVEYIPNFDFDFASELKAVKTTYNGQTIRDFSLNLDLEDNIFYVRDLSALLPGETNIKTSIEVFSNRERVGYTADTLFSTANLDKFVSFLGYEIEPVAQATYKKADLKFRTEGTFNVAKFSPFQLSMDKMILDGELGFIREDRISLFAAVNVDAINLDNYVKAYAPENGQEKALIDIATYYFSKLGVLNDYDVTGMFSAGLLIADNTPVENVNIDFEMKNGSMNIREFSIGQFSNASFEASGGVSGFGEAPKFENFAYNIKTQDVSGVLTRLGVDITDINMNDIKNASIEGTVTGTLKDADLAATVNTGNITTVFNGKVKNTETTNNIFGNIELKAPDFVKFVNDMGYRYNPSVFSLGLFNLKGNFTGNTKKFVLEDINANIGANNFTGKIAYDGSMGRKAFDVDLKNNKFEFDRFFYNLALTGAAKEAVPFRITSSERGDFLSKPFFSKTKFDYEFFKGFDIKGKFASEDISYKNLSLKNISFDMNLDSAKFDITNIAAGYNGGGVRGNVNLVFEDQPVMKGNLIFSNQPMKDSDWAGKKYGFKSGFYNSTITFDTNAASEEEMFSRLNADVVFNAREAVFKGWDLEAIRNDLKNRKQSDGVSMMIRENLAKGETGFDTIRGKITLANSNFTFENVAMENSFETVSVENEGSFNNWSMDANLAVKYKELPDVPEVEFSMTGAIISPVVNVATENLVKLYDSYWEQLAEDRRQQKQILYDKLASMMAEQRQFAQTNQARVHEVVADFTAKKQKSQNADVVLYYEESIKELEAINAEIEEIFQLGQTKEFDESFIDDIKARNEAIAAKIDRASSDVSNLYSKDVRARVNDNYDSIVDLYNEAQNAIGAHRESLNEFNKRLAKVESIIDLENNANIMQFEDDIEKEFLELDGIHHIVRKNYIFIQNTTDLGKLEKYAEEIKNLENKGKQNLEDMKKHIASLHEYLESLVSGEEKAHADGIRDMEVKKKLEENKGTIAVSGREKVITVVRDIEDIEKAEEEVKKEAVRVLDFSGDRSAPSGRVISRNKVITYEEKKQNSEPSGDSFLKKIDDEEVETTGAVVR